MHIAINTRMLIPGKMEGIGYFTFETMSRITRQHPEHKFTFIFDRKFDQSFIFSGNISPVSVFPPARHPILWYAWYEWSLPHLFRKIKPDIFIATDGYLSLSSDIPTLAIIHDLNFEHYPKDLPLFNRLFYRHYFPKYAGKAKRIVAVSEFTKSDLINTYKISPSKIDVVYNGAGERFKPVSPETISNTQKIFTKGKPYFLFVGALHQRKNIANLLRAFDEFKKTVTSPMQLVLVGQKRWWTKEMEDVYLSMSFKEDVIFTGRISDDDLLNITASAFAITYISSFEGFGIPIVEAMRCNVPVITSNISSMPEIAGNAALLCDPFSVVSIRDAMIKIYNDDALRNLLIEKGKTRQQQFTWQKSSEILWDVVEKIL